MSFPTEKDLKEKYTRVSEDGRLIYLDIGVQTFEIETYQESHRIERQRSRVDFFRNMLAKALLIFLKENTSEN